MKPSENLSKMLEIEGVYRNVLPEGRLRSLELRIQMEILRQLENTTDLLKEILKHQKEIDRKA